jgi:hypothetical protein
MLETGGEKAPTERQKWVDIREGFNVKVIET